ARAISIAGRAGVAAAGTGEVALLHRDFFGLRACAFAAVGVQGRDGVAVGLSVLDGVIRVGRNAVGVGDLFKSAAGGSTIDPVSYGVRDRVPVEFDGRGRGYGDHSRGCGG